MNLTVTDVYILVLQKWEISWCSLCCLQWLDQKMLFGSKYVYTREGSDEEVVVRDDDEVVLSASDDESDDGEVSQKDEDNNK